MISVTKCKYFPTDFTTTSGADVGSDYLLAPVGAKVTAIIEFYVKVSSENITLITSAADNTITRTDSGSFIRDGFQIGNSIMPSGIGADSINNSIADVTDKVISVGVALTTTSTYFNGSIYRTNLVTAGDFYYNLIENDAPDSFVSLIDSETQQRYSVNGISATGTTGTYIVTSNSKGYSIDVDGFGVTVDGLGISNFKQYFRITHVFIVTPIALYSQIENLENSMPPAPDYFADRKCLRHVFKVNMKINKTDPDFVDTITFSRKGNTAWYDEYLNGEPATYSAVLNSYTYNAAAVTEVQYDDSVSTIADITISSSGATFTTGTTAVVQIVYIPQDQSAYTNTPNRFRQVFSLDRATVVCGSSASGIQNGTVYTNYKQINSVASTFVNASTISLSANFRMGSSLKTLLASNAPDDRNYLIYITVQSPTITQSKSSDAQSVIVDVNSYGKDLDDSTLLTINPNVTYYNASGGLQGSVLNGKSGDIVRAVAPFQVKNSGSQLLYSVGVRTDAVYTGSTGTFTIEEWVADTSGFCLDDGVQEISISQTKGYRLPSGHVLNNITVSRNTALDTAARAGYILSYPFQLRYETWRPLENADCDFGNATQDWSAITAKSGWSIKQYVTHEVYDPTTDHVTPFEQECEINVYPNTATGSTGSWGTVTTYDDAGLLEQYGDILNYENTTVVADFYGSFGSLPVGTTGYYAMLFLDQQTIGGANWVYPFSSAEDLRQDDDNSPWMGATGATGVCTITIVSSTHIRVKAKLDYRKLTPSINNYNLRAKLDFTK